VLGTVDERTTHEKERDALRAREKELIDRNPDLQAWEDSQQKLAQERVSFEKDLKRAQRRVFKAPDPEPETGPLYPAADSSEKHLIHVTQLKQMILVLRSAESLLGELQSQYLEERRLVREAIDNSQALDRNTSTNTPAEKNAQSIGIRDVERLAREMRASDRRLAQIKALEEQAEFDVERTKESVQLQFTALPDLETVPSSFEEDDPWLKRELVASEKLYARNKALRARFSIWIDSLQDAAKGLFETRASFYRIKRYQIEKDLKSKESLLRRARNLVRVTPEEKLNFQKRFEKSQRLRTENLQRLREEASNLQSSQIGRTLNSDDPFDPSRIRDLKLMAIAERRNLEQAKLNRDLFRRDVAVVLNGILGGQSPGKDFLEKHLNLLNIDYLNARLKQLRHRCESWRRERGSVRENAEGIQNVAARDTLLKVYGEIEDVCDRQQRVWSHRNFLVQLTQHHIDRLKRSQRGLLWYLPRVLLSLLFALIAFLLIRILGRFTKKAASGQLAKIAEQTSELLGPMFKNGGSPRLYRNLAVLTYFLGATAIITGAALVCTGLVWGVEFDLQRIGEWATHPLLSLSGSDVSLWTIIRLVLIVSGAIWLARFIQSFMANHLLQYFDMDRGVRDAMSTLIRYIVLLVGLSVGLASVGIGSGAIAVLFGVIGIGIGFGLQNITSNFVSGLIILFERPIRKGDYVEAGSLFGEVTEINARATTIETRDAISVIVPNSEFINGRVVNWTHGSSQSIRAQIRIGVAYGSDIEMVESVLLGVAQSSADVLDRPAPHVHLSEFGDSAMIFELYFWSRRVFSMPTMISDLNKQIVAEFRENEITIPFPQRDVHVVHTKDDI
jgi:small-conductance mechanosensitive channel